MGFFRKKTEEENQKKETLKQDKREALMNKADAMMQSKGFTLKYYGGHPMYSRESLVNVLVDETKITVKSSKFTSTGELFSISLEDVLKVHIEKEEEVIRRYTATRIALFGPFALAMKKKKVNKKEYLVIECKDFIATFDSNQTLCKYIYMKINQCEKNNSKKSSQVDNLEQIKKLKELLDMCAITQEEFDMKKKELLGL